MLHITYNRFELKLFLLKMGDTYINMMKSEMDEQIGKILKKNKI